MAVLTQAQLLASFPTNAAHSITAANLRDFVSSSILVTAGVSQTLTGNLSVVGALVGSTVTSTGIFHSDGGTIVSNGTGGLTVVSITGSGAGLTGLPAPTPPLTLTATNPEVAQLTITAYPQTPFTISHVVGDGTTATITTTSPHGFQVGWTVKVVAVTATTLNDTAVLTAVTSNTFSYLNSHVVASAADTGTATLKPQGDLLNISVGSQGGIEIDGQGNAVLLGPLGDFDFDNTGNARMTSGPGSTIGFSVAGHLLLIDADGGGFSCDNSGNPQLTDINNDPILSLDVSSNIVVTPGLTADNLTATNELSAGGGSFNVDASGNLNAVATITCDGAIDAGDDITTSGAVSGADLHAGDGASGTFTTTDKVVTVVDGIITSISTI